MIVLEQSTIYIGMMLVHKSMTILEAGADVGGAEYKLLWQVKLDSRVKTLTARSVAILASRAICYPNPGQRGVSSLVVVLCTGSAQLCLVLGFGVYRVYSHFKQHS